MFSAQTSLERCGAFSSWCSWCFWRMYTQNQPCLKPEIPFAFERIVLGIFSLDESRVWVIFSLKWNLLHRQAIPFQQPLFLICWVKAQGLSCCKVLGQTRPEDEQYVSAVPHESKYMLLFISQRKICKKNTQSTLQKSHGVRGSSLPLEFHIIAMARGHGLKCLTPSLRREMNRAKPDWILGGSSHDLFQWFIFMVIVSPLKIGLFPLQMAFLWFINGGYWPLTK